jgi:hypothetical protein
MEIHNSNSLRQALVDGDKAIDFRIAQAYYQRTLILSQSKIIENCVLNYLIT